MPRHGFKLSPGFPLHPEKSQSSLTGLEEFPVSLWPSFHIAPLVPSAPHPLPCPCPSNIDCQSLLFFRLARSVLVLESFHFLSGILLPWYLTSLPPSCLTEIAPSWWGLPSLPALFFIAPQSPFPALFLIFVKVITTSIIICIYLLIASFSLNWNVASKGQGLLLIAKFQVLQWCLILSTCSVNTCWISAWINKKSPSQIFSRWIE